jgi:hypothetical protein
VQAYLGSSLSAGIGKKNLYDFLGLKFAPSPSSGSTASTPTTSAK